MSSNEYARTAANLLGIPNKKITLTALPESSTDTKAPTTAWEVYNNRAAISDRELIKDWNASLNTLLVFAALYSAVLTAFIIASMDLLQEDPAEVTRDILLTLTKQLANNSTPAFERPPFKVPTYALRVNACFFISIVFSLFAAFGAVMAMQWVSNYDFGLNPSSPMERALQRHFRFKGIKEWKMPEIIASLPILLFLSLFLFLVGLADWLFQIHRAISALIIVGVGSASIFYASTTILAIRHVGAPFRTPVSKSLPLLYHNSVNFVRSRIPLFLREDDLDGQQRQTDYSFTKREERAIHENPFLKLDGLLWAINSIDILPHARDTFKLLLEAFMELPAQQLLNRKINKAPWSSIFRMLCQPHLRKKSRDEYSENELKSGEIPFLAQAIAMIGDVGIEDGEMWDMTEFLESLHSSTLFPEPDALSAYAHLALWRHGYDSSRSHLMYSLANTVVGIHVCPSTFVNMALPLLHQAQCRDQLYGLPYLHANVAQSCNIHIKDITSTLPLPNEVLDMLSSILAADIARQNDLVGPSLRRYLYAFEEAQSSGRLKVGDAYYDAASAIRRQYMARLAQIHQNTRPSSDLYTILSPLYDLTATASGQLKLEVTRDILRLLTKSPFKLWELVDDGTRLVVASVMFCNPATFTSLIDPDTRHFTDETWNEWLVQVSIGCDDRLQEDGYSSDEKVSFLRLYCRLLQSYFSRWSTPIKDDRLDALRSPYVAFATWGALHFEHELPVLESSLLPEVWTGPLWDEVVRWFIPGHHLSSLPPRPAFYIPIRAVLMHGSPVAQERLFQSLEWFAYREESENSKEYRNIRNCSQRIFEEPVLHRLLTIPGAAVKQYRQEVLYWLAHYSWFGPEFARIGGFAWLEYEISPSENHTWAIRMITQAMRRASSLPELTQWTNCLRVCLYKIPEETDEPSLNDVIYSLKSLVSKMSKQRSLDRSVMINPRQHGYADVRSWAECDWISWRTQIEELMTRLRRGYILYDEPRYVVDPESICTRKDRYLSM